MSEDENALDRVRAQVLYHLEELNRAQAEAAAAGIDLTGGSTTVEALMTAITQLVRNQGNSDLADRLHAAHTRFVKANDLRGAAAEKWGEDVTSPDKEHRAKRADEAADDAFEELERVFADVSAFLKSKGGQ